MKRHTHLTIAILLVILAAAASLRADDTEIYGVVSTPSIPPNVLIIFDTSGSMATEDVPGDPYEPATTYSGSYTTSAVYQRVWNGHSYQWTLFTDSIDNIACPGIKTDLLSEGNAVGNIRATNFTCGGTTQRRLRLGNFSELRRLRHRLAPEPHQCCAAGVDGSHHSNQRRTVRHDGVQL